MARFPPLYASKRPTAIDDRVVQYDSTQVVTPWIWSG